MRDQVLALDGVLGAHDKAAVALDQEAFTGAATSLDAPSAPMRATDLAEIDEVARRGMLFGALGQPSDVS